jgi:hypothetical protein
LKQDQIGAFQDKDSGEFQFPFLFIKKRKPLIDEEVFKRIEEIFKKKEVMLGLQKNLKSF